MEIKASAEITRTLKEEWDKSKNKREWKVLTGQNPRGRYDLFISTSDRLWQLKFEQIGRNEAIGVGFEAGKIDEEIRALMSMGSPVPFGLISPQKFDLAIIIAGIQQYSSYSTELLCREYISREQARLDERLDEELEEMAARDPLFRRRYKEQKERERIPYV